MWMAVATLGYIDPSTTQHVFSLLGPILACLATMGGLAIAVVVFIRHRIASYFRQASWLKRVVTALVMVGVFAIVVTATWWIFR